MKTIKTEMPMLFTPIELRSVVARNRIVVSPMCQYVSVDGSPTDWQLVHLGRFAVGGAGIVFGEETAVEARGRKSYHCAGFYDDRQIREYRRITDFIKSCGAVPAIQLGHCGRRAGTHGAMQEFAPLTEEDARQGRPPWSGISPSAIPTRPGARVPLAMDRDDIRANLAAWRDAARRSVDAGYDVLEIHGAHGYLIHQFLSPLSNTRTDGYGGDLAGRMRFALEVADAVRDAWPADRPLFFRVSAVEGAGGDWVMQDTIALASALKEHGVDVVDCSSGGIMGSSSLAAVPRVPGYHVGYASEVRHRCGLPTVAVGLITQARHAETILQEGHADMIAISRELMYNPHWPVHAAKELGHPDPLGMLPDPESFRLRKREAQASEYLPGSEVSIPFGHEENVRYSWDKQRAEPRKTG
jgi:2,4-dienoyl-CoA reductase-like NADH-dependent reductase (Old Yellow Enzyme family)